MIGRLSAAVVLLFACRSPASCGPPHLPATGQVISLRSAIGDLIDTFADRFPDGHVYLAELDDLERHMAAATPENRAQLAAEFWSLQGRALAANPLVSQQELLFVVRRQYAPDHHNTATMFQTGEINAHKFAGGGALKTIHLGRGGEVKTLYESPGGVARDPTVGFDGKEILFSLRHDTEDDYHIYEIRSDGTGLRQLTFGAGVSDIDPVYLPSGKILFTSTREPKYCMCNRHIMGNLFTMDADGGHIEQIGHSTLHEGHASLLPDGRIIYDRWEYVDRNFGDAQGVWSTNPDGTNHAIFWGNNTNSPGGVLDARHVPGSGLFVAIFSSCHDRPWGALALVDRRIGIDGRQPVRRTWPASAIDLVGKGNYDTFKQVQPKYEDPFPLSEKYFLCARTTGQGEQMGIYLLDTFGNEVLLYAEGPGCFDPMPLAPCVKPPAISTRVEPASRDGYFYVADVYAGTGMDKVQRGRVKSLRVVESPEKRFWTQTAWNGSGTQAPGMAWNDFNNKRILGSVPVESDGSVYFALPADTYVFFQLLDEKGMMIQSMRSGTIVRPGERVGCAGCHESRRAAVSNHPALALERAPSELTPWYGPARNFNYLAEVQPVFDKHCVSCHDFGTVGGETLNLAGDLGLIFNTSYFQLRSKNYVRVVGAGPSTILPPMSWGSHTSPLVDVLLRGHKNRQLDIQIKLDSESFDRIVTWIDINAPYYPEYASAYPDNQYGRSPLGAAQLKRLSELTGVNLADQKFAAHVNFSRPELSPCLAAIDQPRNPRYTEALSIIRAGAQLLARRPRADMPGFGLSGIDAKRQARYTSLVEEAVTSPNAASGTKQP